MIKYRCNECGTIFDLDESETVQECVGEFWGAPAYNGYVGCPRCRCIELESFESDDEEAADL